MINNTPLVSIGIPTYNRPEGLRKTLDCITQQTYKNLEIIVSNNCSTNPEVEKVVNEYKERDERIKCFRQSENIGAANNFKFVVKKATGEYFMWAADDDEWENFYIEQLICEFKNNKAIIAVNFEAQYTDQTGNRFDFFSEGKPFYSFESTYPYDRLYNLLRFNYGNLVYSLYKTSALKNHDLIFVENEIPFLIKIALQGNWKVLPQIGFYKKTNPITYRQARWEKTGGWLPDSFYNFKHIMSLKHIYKYHKEALRYIKKSIDSIKLENNNKLKLVKLAKRLIWKHFIYIVIRYKPKPF